MSESTLHAVARMIREVMDGDLDDVEITPETRFSDDLELESIEFVALAEAIEAHWGDRVDFTAWLASQSIDQVIGLTVGELVDFVDGCLD